MLIGKLHVYEHVNYLAAKEIFLFYLKLYCPGCYYRLNISVEYKNFLNYKPGMSTYAKDCDCMYILNQNAAPSCFIIDEHL